MDVEGFGGGGSLLVARATFVCVVHSYFLSHLFFARGCQDGARPFAGVHETGAQ